MIKLFRSKVQGESLSSKKIFKKIYLAFGSPMSVLGMRVTKEEHNLVISENMPINNQPIESSRRDHFIDMVVNWFIFKNK